MSAFEKKGKFRLREERLEVKEKGASIDWEVEMLFRVKLFISLFFGNLIRTSKV